MDRFKNNLKLLNEHDPALAERAGREPNPEEIHVVEARDGLPIPQVGSVSLHSTYRPGEEAAKAAAQFKPDPGARNVVYGLGFGHHVRSLLILAPGEWTVIEPSMKLFRAFLQTVDLSPFLPRTRFLVAEPQAKILARLMPGTWNVFPHRASMRVFDTYFARLEAARERAGYLEAHPLKVLVVNPMYGGSLPTAQFCARALENLGHIAAPVECERFREGFFSLKQVTRNPENARILSEQFMHFMGELAAAKAAEFKPDLILALAQAPLTPKALERLKALKIPIAFWFVEDFRTLPYWKDVAASYDHFFCIQRDEFPELLKQQGAQRPYYLPQACFPGVHRPLELSEADRRTYGADLSFMGAAYYNRVKTFPRLLDFDFKIWGTEWNLDSAVGKRVQNANWRIDPEEAVKIYNAGTVNLNLHSSTFHEDINPEGDFVNPRTFEIAACGGFQLVDMRSLLPELLVPGEEIVTFTNVPDLKEKIAYYIKHDEERRHVAGRGRARVLAEHTLEHRMREMLIEIYTDRAGELRERVSGRKEAIDLFIEQAGAETELGRYLDPFRGRPDFTLKKAVEAIQKGEGALDDTETLLLMVNQLVKQEDADA